MDLSGQFPENESGDDNGPSIASMREATTSRIVASRDARAAREADSTAKYKERRASREIVRDPITGGLSRGGQPLSYGPNRATLATLRNIHSTITDPSGNVVHKRDDSSTGRLMGDTLSAVTGRKEGAVASDETSEVYTASQAREMRTAPTAGDDVKQSAGLVNRPNIIGEQAAKRKAEREAGEARPALPSPAAPDSRTRLRGEGLSRSPLPTPTPSSGRIPPVDRTAKPLRRGEAFGPAQPMPGDYILKPKSSTVMQADVFDGSGWNRVSHIGDVESGTNALDPRTTQPYPRIVPSADGKARPAFRTSAEYYAAKQGDDAASSAYSRQLETARAKDRVNQSQLGTASVDAAPRTPVRGVSTSIENRAAGIVGHIAGQVARHTDGERLTASQVDAVATRKLFLGDPSEAIDPADITTAGDIAKLKNSGETAFRNYTVAGVEPRLTPPQSTLGAGMVNVPTGKMRKMEGDPGGVQGKTFAHDLYAKALEGTRSIKRTLTPKEISIAEQPAQGGGRSITEAGHRVLSGDTPPRGLGKHGMRVLQHIKEHKEITGSHPSYEMIAEALDLGTRGNAQRVVRSLVNAGLMGSTEARGNVTSATDDPATRRTVGSSTAGPRTKREPIKNKTAPDLLPKGMGSEFDPEAAARVQERREAKKMTKAETARYIDDRIDPGYDEKREKKPSARVISSKSRQKTVAEATAAETPAQKKAGRAAQRKQRMSDAEKAERQRAADNDTKGNKGTKK